MRARSSSLKPSNSERAARRTIAPARHLVEAAHRRRAVAVACRARGWTVFSHETGTGYDDVRVDRAHGVVAEPELHKHNPLRRELLAELQASESRPYGNAVSPAESLSGIEPAAY